METISQTDPFRLQILELWDEQRVGRGKDRCRVVQVQPVGAETVSVLTAR